MTAQFVKETDIVYTSMVILYILHYVVFHISDYGQIFKRGYLAEVYPERQNILFSLLFSVSISNFFLKIVFSISRRGWCIFDNTFHSALSDESI